MARLLTPSDTIACMYIPILSLNAVSCGHPHQNGERGPAIIGS